MQQPDSRATRLLSSSCDDGTQATHAQASTRPPTRRRMLGMGLAGMGLTGAGLGALLASPAAHAELAEVRERGSLKIALYKSNLPFSDVGTSGMQGVDAALGKAIAERLKLGVQWLPFEAGENLNDDLRNMVWRGHYLGYGPADLMLQVPIDKRLIASTGQVEFLSPYYRHQLGWLVHDQIATTDLRNFQLEGLSLAAEIGTAAAGALLGQGGGQYRSAVKLQNNGVDAALGVLNSQWDAAYVTRAQAESALAQAPNKRTARFEPMVLQGTPANGWAVGMAIKSGQPELAKAIGLAMKSLQEDGTLVAIYRAQGLQLIHP